jgi:XTP/dITP diphosphohydrolase
MKDLCIASTNDGKIRELKLILGNFFTLYTLKDFAEIPEPEEPYHSFAENAQFKAQYYAKFTKIPTLSDDTGLCIRALDNFPSIRSKRFLFECG